MSSRPLALLLAACLAGCAGSGPPPPSYLRFVDSRIFDDQLQDSLAQDYDSVTVAFEGSDVTVNNLPERLDAWLYNLQNRYDGKVEFIQDRDAGAVGKGLEGLAVMAAVGAFKLAKDRLHYRSLQYYDAAVYYQRGTGAVTRVVFLRKTPN